MCGLAGYVGRNPLSPDRIARTLPLMKNRGPDHQAFCTFEESNLHVVLLHSRLSIIDLDERSHQPFTVDDCTVVFNGEIYNYVELREELRRKGQVFRTESDTEVLLRAYLVFGDSCVERFEGMWSFAIYDRPKRRLLLSRDRFAEKPLYYCRTAEGFFFASEVKYLKALSGRSFPRNERQIMRYLVNGYKSLYKGSETFFEGVEELPYAGLLEVGEEMAPRLRRYWRPAYSPRPMTLAEAVDGFRERLYKSVELRLRADVPLAFCLSGGVDSAALVSIAKKVFHYDVASFSLIDRDERYDESENIQATIQDTGCRNTVIEIPRDGFFERMERLVAYHDAPVYTITYYIHSFLSEAIAKAGYRVAVSGTSADELVTGYYDHFNLHLYEMRDRPEYPTVLRNWEEGPGRFVRNPYLKDPELYLKDPTFRRHIYLNNDIFAGFLKNGFREEFTEEVFCDSLLRNRMLNELFHEATPVILHEDDLNSMYYSIENRSPYLDTELFRFAYSIPVEHLIRDGYAKYVLREAVKGVLNEKVRTDRHKKGFNASIHSVVDLTSPEARSRFLADGPIFELVDREKIRELMDRPFLPNSYSKFLFSFLSAKLFMEMN